MSSVAIRAEGVGKRYTIGRSKPYKTIRESIADATVGRFRPRSAAQSAERSIWALQDVSFEINTGDVVGVVGRNGAGKSTLLRLLSRVTTPTAGTIDLVGRVGSLLEVGTGFHPELTGRENLYLNGAILGMPRVEIRKKFDEIVAFADVEKFIDTPVKHYSSGMYMRLAFAVAAHLEPEILVVDEVLAVGDVGFQRKCMAKMDQVATEGRTVLFVSHSLGIVRQLCTRGILLAAGRVAFQGSVEDVVSRYERDLAATTSAGVWDNPAPDRGADEVYIHRIEVTDPGGSPIETTPNTQGVYIRIHITVHRENDILKVGYDLHRAGSTVFRAQHVDTLQPLGPLREGRHCVSCEIPPHLLNLGDHLIVPLVSWHGVKMFGPCDAAVLRFGVRLDPTVSPYHGAYNEKNHPGAVFPILRWTSD